MDDFNEKLHPPGQSILLFRPGPKHFQENDTLYEGNLRDIEGLKNGLWKFQSTLCQC